MSKVGISFPKGRFKRNAFTLLELLIVILLLSIFAFLIFGTMKQNARTEEALSLEHLSEIMRKNGGQELVCIDDCRECFYLDEHHQTKKAPIRLSPVKAYRVGRHGEGVRLEFGRMHDKKICLRLRSRSNGSLDQMILESKGSFYFIPAFFEETKKFSSLEDAVDYWLKDQQLLRDRGEYY